MLIDQSIKEAVSAADLLRTALLLAGGAGALNGRDWNAVSSWHGRNYKIAWKMSCVTRRLFHAMDRLLCRQTLTSWLPAIRGWTWRA